MKYYIVKELRDDNYVNYTKFTSIKKAKAYMRIQSGIWCNDHDNWQNEWKCKCKSKRISLHEVNEKLITRKGM